MLTILFSSVESDEDPVMQVMLRSIQVGNITGAGKTMVFLIWVTRVWVRCDFFPPMAKPYPLSRYHGVGRVFPLSCTVLKLFLMT